MAIDLELDLVRWALRESRAFVVVVGEVDDGICGRHGWHIVFEVGRCGRGGVWGFGGGGGAGEMAFGFPFQFLGFGRSHGLVSGISGRG